jgi:hypothetical protein
MTASVTVNIRRQLTLFVEQKDAENIEKIRKQFNPKQSELIKSHVTLCREDEIENLEQVLANLYGLGSMEITIEFGKVVRFDNGKGVFLPAKADSIEFHELRRQILRDINDNPRRQEPHITLLHPINSTGTDDIFSQVEEIQLPSTLTFTTISLVEQTDGGPWNIVQEFKCRDDR